MRFRSAAAVLVVLVVALGACKGGAPLDFERRAPAPAALERQCREVVGEPRVIEVTPRILVAVGYDLANTVLVRTDDGNVIVDAGMSPPRARETRAALLARAPGPVRAIVYTHSHIDHVGGASAWVEPAADVWATEAFRDHFLKQYGLFLPAELRRGSMQFGYHASPSLLACSALGRRPDMEGAREAGARMPTRTFSGRARFTVGGVDFDLVEAHGETHDQLFVWIPSERAILSGDNLYEAFPNLYTIRGTAPRPVDDWIRSLDAMRALAPAHLVPSHTRPISGAETVARVLRDYRDGIQWVRDEVVRGANRGENVDALAERIALPPHLAANPFLAELYGQIDWSVRAIYGNALGWFDGDAAALYPAAGDEAARREISLMGGAERVLEESDRAREAGDARWAIHLLAKLRRAGAGDADEVRGRLADAYERLAAETANTNGRAYLFEAAYASRGDYDTVAPPPPPDVLLAEIPLGHFFSIMTTRLRPADAMDVHEAVAFEFPDERRRFTITVRRGVAEVVEGTPLPGTPEPVATLRTDGLTWRRLAVGATSPLEAIARGKLSFDGSRLGLLTFLGRFEKGM